LMTYLETIPPNLESQRGMMYTMIGDPNKDREMLMKYSPALHAADIKAPVIIAQGANDPRVTLSESDQMVEVLNKSGVHAEYLVKEDEGHRFKVDANRFEFYLTMEKFLKEHLAFK
jgi:dipeptidyl aminopeptidase/acylaminoacyl peptidase